MKAVVYEKYGLPENLKLKEVEKPKPKKHEVLINVKATSINSWDWDLLRGKPFWVRTEGLFKPKYSILGCDVAGIVEEVGTEVKNFKVGDRVFGDISGDGWGGMAEYVCADEKLVAIIPEELSFTEAAAIPQAGVIAYQAVNFHNGIKQGDKVLVNGAGGSSGPFAIQLAKLNGAEVTAVDKASKCDFMRSIGADKVIDYKKEDFARREESYDFIIDNVASHLMSEYQASLNKGGVLSVTGGQPSKVLQIMLLGGIISKLSNRKLGILFHVPNTKDLLALTKLISDKKIKLTIDKVFPLEETRKAFEYFGSGNFMGKIVIEISG